MSTVQALGGPLFANLDEVSREGPREVSREGSLEGLLLGPGRSKDGINRRLKATAALIKPELLRHDPT
jgi:hypothetical protein